MGTKANRKNMPNSMSLRRHRKFGGKVSKSPKFRHGLRREAEADERKDRSRLKEPKSSVKDLFHE